MTYTVRIYGSDEGSESGVALLEEHDFTDEAEARKCERGLVAEGAGVVTFNTRRSCSCGEGWADEPGHDADVTEG